MQKGIDSKTLEVISIEYLQDIRNTFGDTGIIGESRCLGSITKNVTNSLQAAVIS